MRIAVTGSRGQIAHSLAERASVHAVEVVTLDRSAVDLSLPHSIVPALAQARADVIVNAGAYTAVDRAESEVETAFSINESGAGLVAAAAHDLQLPVIQLSTDYVFDGCCERPYREDDLPQPISVYGKSKLAGEQAVAAHTGDYAILRTAWVYSPFGTNFVKTMLRLATTRREISVVADQRGTPTCALDIADAVIRVAQNLKSRPRETSLRGTFHMSARGEATWAEFAEAIFAAAAQAGHPPVRVVPITTSEYPTAARRPANSRLDSSKLAAIHGVTLPDWRASATPCVERLLAQTATTMAQNP